MAEIDPQHFASCQQYLEALGFTVNGECFVRGGVTFPVVEIVGYTPVTLSEKMKRRGWLNAEASSVLTRWGTRFTKPVWLFGDEGRA